MNLNEQIPSKNTYFVVEIVKKLANENNGMQDSLKLFSLRKDTVT